ncbi:hypothetical protein NMG60_11001322 [Bertholletia excelsa]
MDEKEDDESFFWMEDETPEFLSLPTRTKRKLRPKKMEFVGWGSRPLIEFLESIGKDITKQISQYEAAAIITEYVNANNLTHPKKKKRILCDDKLHSLFGRKSVGRIKIYDLLEAHFSENQDESDDDFLYSSDENYEHIAIVGKQQKHSTSDRKTPPERKKVSETPKSCFAAIIPANIKHVYLKRSLVQNLLKDSETFEDKVVGSFVRVKSDPNDYLQKNSHQLLQVTGVRKASENRNAGTETLLQVSSMIKDVYIGLLSDDNFSEEECEDLRQRVKSGSLKKPTVVELQQKAEKLHEDITKHWLARELILLQNLIDRANEKGWPFTLFEYLERKQLLQTPSEQSRLLLEVPEVIGDEIELEAAQEDEINGSPKPVFWTEPHISANDFEANGDLLTRKFSSTPAAGFANIITTTDVDCDLSLTRKVNLDSVNESSSNKELKDADNYPGQFVQEQNIQQMGLETPKDSQTRVDEPVTVIELSDDEEDDDLGHHARRSEWHYVDPRGNIQGPFSMESLKRWSDTNYFPPDFKVWKTGQSQDEAVLLSDMILRIFSSLP